MRLRAKLGVLVVLVAVAGCGGDGVLAAGGDLADGDPASGDLAGGDLAGGVLDGGRDLGPGPNDGGVAGGDGGVGACEWGGAPGACMTLTACAAIADHSSEAGSCPGPATIQCCIVTPNVADNPPVPAGYTLMAQSQVTADMTNWAVAILDAPAMYPMFSTAMKTFMTQPVLARVEWHPPDFQNGVIHRGVTLYVPK